MVIALALVLSLGFPAPVSIDVASPAPVHRTVYLPDTAAWSYRAWGRRCHAHLVLGPIEIGGSFRRRAGVLFTGLIDAGTWALDATGTCHWRVRIESPLP